MKTQVENPTRSGNGESAASVGLRYVIDSTRGFSRRRSGKGFVYLDPEGRTIRDAETLRRIRSLVIPPAWTDVWICPVPEGHLQATGRDARGRKQHRYHPDWRMVRDRTKFNRLIAFAEALPAIRKQVARDLRRRELCREKVLATVVGLLEGTLIRVGNAEYAQHNGAYGLTTLRDRHVKVAGERIRFRFRGKGGKHHEIEMSDRRLARVVKRCQEIPGDELFQYLDAEGGAQTIGSGDVNTYLRAVAGEDFSSKDFRTWGATVRAASVLARGERPDTESERKAAVVSAAKEASGLLGNTPAICRKCYIHPGVLEAYLDRGLAPMPPPRGNGGSSRTSLDANERAVLQFLKRWERGSARRARRSVERNRRKAA